MAIFIAFLGLLFTGFTVTLGLHAGNYCVKRYKILEKIEAIENVDHSF